MKNKKRRDVMASMLAEFMDLLPDATRAFHEIVTALPDDQPVMLSELQEIEALANQRYEHLLEQVAKTFLTPFDRDDMYRLLERLDDIVDELERAGSLVVTLNINPLPAAYISNSEILSQMGAMLTDAVGELKKPKKVTDELQDYYACEAEMDRNTKEIMVSMLAPGADPLLAVQMTTLLHAVERATEDMNRFARALGAIAIRES